MSTPHYFKSFPNLDYTIAANRAGIPTTIQIKDYFHLLRIRDDIFKNDTLYYQYVVKNGERPDQVSYKEYGQEGWYWIVLQTNDIVDYYNEWPLSFQELEKFILKKYGSYEKAGEPHHWETEDTFNEDGNLVLHGGLEVSKDFYYEYPMIAGGSLFKTAFPVPVSNREHEERLNEKKSHINLIQQKYIPDIIRDINNYSTNLKVEGSKLRFTPVQRVF